MNRLGPWQADPVLPALPGDYVRTWFRGGNAHGGQYVHSRAGSFTADAIIDVRMRAITTRGHKGRVSLYVIGYALYAQHHHGAIIDRVSPGTTRGGADSDVPICLVAQVVDGPSATLLNTPTREGFSLFGRSCSDQGTHHGDHVTSQAASSSRAATVLVSWTVVALPRTRRGGGRRRT